MMIEKRNSKKILFERLSLHEKVLKTISVGVQTNVKKRNLKSGKNYELVFT